MDEGGREINQDNAITFRINSDPGEPAIRMNYDGTFFIKGCKVTEDKELYDAFVAFFQETGHYQEKNMTNKTLNNTNMKDLEKNVPDVQIHGNPDAWVCICKASSKEQGWMKSTKAMQLADGVLVQVSTQQGDHVAEALEFLPNASIQEIDGGFRIY